MATFNTPTAKPTARSFIRSRPQPSGTNDLGGDTYLRDLRSELYLLAIAMLDVKQDTWHEKGDARVERFKALVRDLAVSDAKWTAGMLGHLRSEMFMRSASIIGAAEFAKARLDAGLHGLSRQVVHSVLQRADEPGELIAYWTSTYGRRLPKPIKRGIADAVRRLYNEQSLLKWDSPQRAWRFADVLSLVRPKPRAEWQSAVFAYALNRRHGQASELPPGVPMLRYRRELMSTPVAERRTWLVKAARAGEVGERLRAAGMTWESVAGWLQGPMDATAWEAIIPAMNYMARLRNLRNLDQAGVSDAVAHQVADYLADPVQVARSKQFPFRFLSAYRATEGSLRWAWPLEQALRHSLANVPQLPGNTLVLVDRSPSMWEQKMSEKSDMDWADGAALFGAALALRAEHADLVQFGSDHRAVRFDRSESVLKLVQRFDRLSGTDIPAAITGHLRPAHHDRVVVVTDEQTRPGYLPYYESHISTHGYPLWRREHVNVDDVMPRDIPLYMWNFGGYEGGAMSAGLSNRHTFGGLTDAAFEIIPRIERGQDADWPWAA